MNNTINGQNYMSNASMTDAMDILYVKIKVKIHTIH